MELENRVVVLVDMDCFYCQVEEKLNPELKGKPIAVVQYNPWKGGGIIAVNYVARAQGVIRGMRGEDAKEKCPDIELPSVPCIRGKADISKYRDAGKDVAKVLHTFTPLLERASIDEAYLDITELVQERQKTLDEHSISTKMIPNTFALGYDSVEAFFRDVQYCANDSIDFDYEHAKRLLVGTVIVSEIRAAVYKLTGYTCSAGIAHNKILAKLVCGMNKPNKQTVLPKHSVNILYKTLPVKKVKHLGGKFGDTVCEILKISTMEELQRFSEKQLQVKFDEKNGTWLYNIARGVDQEPVQTKINPKSIGCCKNFKFKAALLDFESVKKWLIDLGDEIEDRLEKDALENNRSPKQLVVSFATQHLDGRDTNSSRSYNFAPDDDLCGELFSAKALELLIENVEGVKVRDIIKNRKLKTAITFLGISVGKFEDHESKKTRKINDYFGAGSSKEATSVTKNKPADQLKYVCNKKEDGKEYILQKYLETVNGNESSDGQLCKKSNGLDITTKNKIFEASLEKQESFFAKFLKGSSNDQSKERIKHEVAHPSTPVCDVINYGDDSNDTNYSSSTINVEINKSIALFDEDQETVTRVSDMRQLLNNSSVNSDADKYEDVLKINKDAQIAIDLANSAPNKHETYKCEDCGKMFPVEQFQTHADYHFALKLREEEKQLVRNERARGSDKKNTTSVTESGQSDKQLITEEQCNKNLSATSITSFLVKVDNSVPTETCSQCGKKIPVEKLAEHLDFHEAQKLSRELNNKRVTTVAQKFCSPIHTKRKRKTNSPVKSVKKTCKSIDSFFSR